MKTNLLLSQVLLSTFAALADRDHKAPEYNVD